MNQMISKSLFMMKWKFMKTNGSVVVSKYI